ncbi:MAG: chromosome segregation protein SMC, partial [Phormidesmis sp. CAN_BIN36]|nr:chromosome segregation protein SMC [Phormidesmis sp. CAN_BIN36]
MYVKRVELTNFKSFGGTTPIPLLPGFTVISGPNGSGKSNLLDALLFCLGLAGSKGMRAERLPDLVNHTQTARGRSTVEAAVTATFDLSDELDLLNTLGKPEGEDFELTSNQNGHANGNSNGNGASETPNAEWSVTRKLRVTQQGTYTSNYFINGEPCTLTELHEQLNRLRIYPEGYNVVLQGDVTRIISMNAKERREIIDEMAGVASFDRKINQAKDKLDVVKEREDKYHIVERELIDQRDRLAQDRIKAEKYQKLRAELQAKEQWEVVIRYQQAARSVEQLQAQIQTGEAEIVDLTTQIAAIAVDIEKTSAELEKLNAHVRSLGEEEQIALQSTLATREAELRQLQRQEQDLQTASRTLAENLARSQQEIHEQTQTLESLTQEQQTAETQDLAAMRQQRDDAKQTLEVSREAANVSAASAEAWVQEHTELRHQIDTLLTHLEPKRTEQAQLRERASQLERQIQEQTRSQQTLAQQLTEKQTEHAQLATSLEQATAQIQSIAQAVSAAEQEAQVQKETQTRLLNEQRDKQRTLDKLEAQSQAIQEAQGTHATQVILKMGMSGVHGLVAQLGRVEPRYQMALETAAGGRLGQLVVDDDAIAAAAIEILKQKRAGRATFLPLNKIRAGRPPSASTLRSMAGCVDFAINLIECDDRYWEVFSYVFGSTVVFQAMSDARRYIGQYRIVTLDGELLEQSGAMTGGSSGGRSPIRFGTVDAGESAEITTLRERLKVIDAILFRCEDALTKATVAHQKAMQHLIEARQQHRELQLKSDQTKTETQRLETQQFQVSQQLQKSTQELTIAQTRLQTLETEIPAQETQLEQLRQTLADLEQSQTHSEWQQIQLSIRSLEADLSQKELALRTVEQRLLQLDNQRQRLQEKIQQGQARIQEHRTQQTGQLQQQSTIGTQQLEVTQHIAELQFALATLEKTLGSERQQRDRVDRQLRDLQTRQQQLEWQRGKVQETQV